MQLPGNSDHTAISRLVAAYGIYYLDNQPVLLRSAELDYARLPAQRWADRLQKLRDSGSNAVTARVPWSWHEPDQGTLDFEGLSDARRDLVSFVAAVHSAGLVFLARPGPCDSAARRGFGHPAWLHRTIPEALARRPDGRPATTRQGDLYSLLHPAYLAEVERWYAAVAQVLRPFLNAPVVSWQLGDAPGAAFAHAIGRLDYNPDTVARYRTFLQQAHGDIKSLSHEWRRPVENFCTLLPPTTRGTPGELHDWQRFLETWVARHLEHLRAVTRRLGIDLPLVVNEPADYRSPQNPQLNAAVADLYGFASRTQPDASVHEARSPFAGSHSALRFQQFAAEERPLSCWGLDGMAGQNAAPIVSPASLVHGFGAGLAHGVKGYILDLGSLPPAYQDAAGRLQAFAGAHETELTASVEVQDSIAYLDYQPYTRFTADGFPAIGALADGLIDQAPYTAFEALSALHAVLLTLGYNPPFLDLEAATDHALADFAAAVFPSRGYLDLENYGKLVVFTLRGGTLVTFPEPVTRQKDGTPLKTAFLWPHAPSKTRRLDRNQLIRSFGGRWRSWGRWLPGSSPRGVRLQLAQSAATLRGDYQLAEFGDGVAGGEVLLRHGRAVAAYRVQVRDGTSTLLGAIPGGAFTTPRYSMLRAAERRTVRRFALSLFEDVVPRQIVPDDALEIEAIARLSPDGGCLLFVINRLGAQTGSLRFPAPSALNLGESIAVDVLYSAFGSRAHARAEGLVLELVAGDVLVVRLR